MGETRIFACSSSARAGGRRDRRRRWGGRRKKCTWQTIQTSRFPRRPYSPKGRWSRRAAGRPAWLPTWNVRWRRFEAQRGKGRKLHPLRIATTACPGQGRPFFCPVAGKVSEVVSVVATREAAGDGTMPLRHPPEVNINCIHFCSVTGAVLGLLGVAAQRRNPAYLCRSCPPDLSAPNGPDPY